MVQICLFGAGRIGRDHAWRVAQSNNGKLYCVVDPDLEAARKTAEEHRAIVYKSAGEALADPKVEAVLIASTSDTHVDLIIASAQAGLPIFCEKPIDLDMERIERCLEVVEAKNVPLFVAFNRRFDPSFQMLKQRLDAGEVGKVEQLILTSRDAPFPPLSYLKRSGGLFCDMTIHDFDMARWLLGEEPYEIYATGSVLIDKELSNFNDIDTAMVVMKTRSGVLCQINNSRRSAYGYDQRIEIFGEKGMLRANNVVPTTLEFSFGQGVKTDRALQSFPERYREAYQREIDHFIDEVVIAKRPPAITGYDGKQAILLAHTANASLRSQSPCYLGETAPSYHKRIEV